MAEDLRPSWCDMPECLYLTSYDEAICVGRLPEKRRHDELWNTHNLCEGPDTRWEINDADAWYYLKCMAAVRKDIADNGLYNPGKGDWYDF